MDAFWVCAEVQQHTSGAACDRDYPAYLGEHAHRTELTEDALRVRGLSLGRWGR